MGMKRLVPTRRDLIILAILAIVCALAMTVLSATYEKAIAAIGFPLLLTSMLMGARRSGKLDAAARPQREQTID